jgi:putative transposase
VTWAIEEKDYSQRRACHLVGFAPKTYRYVSRRADDGKVRVRLRALANERRRFGYRRLHILLAREGAPAEPQEAVPPVPGRTPWGASAWRAQARAGHAGANGAAAGDEPTLVAGLRLGRLACGPRFRVLAVVDDFTGECLALVADTSLSGRHDSGSKCVGSIRMAARILRILPKSGSKRHSWMMASYEERSAERRWVIVARDGRYVTLARATDPTEAEILAAENSLVGQGASGWLAIMLGNPYVGAKPRLMQVRELGEPGTTFDEAAAACVVRISEARKDQSS